MALGHLDDSRRQISFPLGGRYRQVSLYVVQKVTLTYEADIFHIEEGNSHQFSVLRG